MATAVAVVSLLAVPGAQAATEVGSDCAGDAVVEERTFVGLTRAGNPFPLAVPAPGIVTRWKVQAAPGLTDLLAQRLVVLRPGEKANTFLTVDESETELVEVGANEFRVRIPVRAGDRFGLTGFRGTLFCDAEGSATSGVYEGATFTGEVSPFQVVAGIGTPVSAIVEPDADRDGYGDETQDKCPRSAVFHRDACSAVRLGLKAKVRERSILVRVSADMDVSVQVFGSASWGFRPKPKESAARRKKGNVNLIVGLRGGKKDVSPGKASVFRVGLPKTVMRRLSRITPQESVRAEITALATDSEGALAERRLRLRLPGQEGT